MAKVTKLKTAAQNYVPQTRNEVADHINLIGSAQRELTRIELDIDDTVSQLRLAQQPKIEQLSNTIADLSAGVQTWCEAHRDEITDGGKVKFANLVTGEVNWRQRPPKVKTRGTDLLFEKLDRLGFKHLIRNNPELNKDAILANPKQAADAGIEITTGVEDFVITPYEQQLAA
jgi:phage host-nuclease inhibitor protein Gam